MGELGEFSTPLSDWQSQKERQPRWLESDHREM